MSINFNYSASGGEKYMVISNFFDDLNTNRITVNPTTPDSGIYYYIDDISIEEIKPVALHNDTTVTFCDTVLLGKNLDSASTYSWWPNKFISDTTSLNPSAWPDSTTTYYVMKTQCSSVTVDSITITVTACDVGINENKMAEVKVYPNPFSGTTNFLLSHDGKYNLKILDISGTLIEERNFSGKKYLFENEEMQKGIYFYEIKDELNRIVRGKLIFE